MRGSSSLPAYASPGDRRRRAAVHPRVQLLPPEYLLGAAVFVWAGRRSLPSAGETAQGEPAIGRGMMPQIWPCPTHGSRRSILVSRDDGGHERGTGPTGGDGARSGRPDGTCCLRLAAWRALVSRSICGPLPVPPASLRTWNSTGLGSPSGRGTPPPTPWSGFRSDRRAPRLPPRVVPGVRHLVLVSPTVPPQSRSSWRQLLRWAAAGRLESPRLRGQQLSEWARAGPASVLGGLASAQRVVLEDVLAEVTCDRRLR